jgi:predicted acylesterase/phospholipase RssA
MLKPCWEPWRGGVLSLDAVIARLAKLLPPTFEELERDFAVGVVTAEGEHLLIDSGPLPEAVAASAAIPFIFSSVDVPGAHSSGAVAGPPLAGWRRAAQRVRGGGGASIADA